MYMDAKLVDYKIFLYYLQNVFTCNLAMRCCTRPISRAAGSASHLFNARSRSSNQVRTSEISSSN